MASLGNLNRKTNQQYFASKANLVNRMNKIVGEDTTPIIYVGGFPVKKKTPIVKGVEVIKVGGPKANGSAFAWGSENECTGTVEHEELLPGGKKRFHIAFKLMPYDNYREYEESLVALVDYKESLKDNPDFLSRPLPKASFELNAVVFLKKHPEYYPSPGYPAIGSEYETDVKIVEVVYSEFGNHLSYKAYSPGFGYLEQLKESCFMSAEERNNLRYKSVKYALFSVDSLPFFKQNEKVKVVDGKWIKNHDETVVVELTETNKNYLNYL